MNKTYRTQLVLGALLAAQCLLIVVLRSPFTNAHGPAEARLLLPELDGSAIRRIELTGGDGSVTLENSGGGWGITEQAGFPVDGVKVDDLLKTLLELRVREPVVTSSRHHDSLKIADDDNEGRVRLYAAEERPVADLIFGSSPNYRVLHLRLAGDDAVYEVRGMASYDVRPDPDAWADKALVTVDASTVREVRLSNVHGDVTLTREEDGWTVTAGGEVAPANGDEVEQLVGALCELRLIKPADDGAETGLAEAVATATLQVLDGEDTREIVVRVGSPVAGNESQRYVTKDGYGYNGIVWESAVQAVLERRLEDLVAS